MGGSHQILDDANPRHRGAPDATTGIHAAVAVAYSEIKQTTFQIRIGAKLIPEVAMAGGNVVSHLKMQTGIESLREGFSNLHSFDNNKEI